MSPIFTIYVTPYMTVTIRVINYIFKKVVRQSVRPYCTKIEIKCDCDCEIKWVNDNEIM